MPDLEYLKEDPMVEDRKVVGILAANRDAAKELFKQLQGQVDTEDAKFDEAAIVYKNDSGDVKFNYLREHPVLIGTGVGAAVSVASLIPLMFGFLPLLFIPLLPAVIVGALAGGAMANHPMSHGFLKEMGGHLDRGGAAVVILADPAVADMYGGNGIKDGHKVIAIDLAPKDMELMAMAMQEDTHKQAT
jgi:uncharacterized membrane protein